MIMLLYGKDTSRSLQKLAEIRFDFTEKVRGEIVILENETTSCDTLRHHLQTDGLFSSDKLIIIKNVITDGGIQNLREFLPLIKTSLITAPQIKVIFFERDVLDAKHALIKELIAATVLDGKEHYPEHAPLNQKEVCDAIARELANAGKTIEPDALSMLARAITDSFLLASELNKLLHAEARHITKDVLSELSPRDINDSIFQLTDAISGHRAHDALSMLARLLKRGSEPLYVLAMLHRHARIITKINSYLDENPRARPEEIAGAIKEHPFAVKKTLPSARQISKSATITLYENLLETDRCIKKSAASKEALLARLVCKMSG
ncbi:MAG: DNA polymerase III subunit delta [Candidatus Jacksonbacteria bacterium RIFCSPLOWO2_02_FULL_44_20]|uniref:DNA-directed DNA polymerase n=1 Tax=Candidatus Jacksonbacteria bacterium RIFCSPLOWO2_02_FULL_44_20 TaxID=1798460 RepID=A0A1G2A6G6_9BACT|nr:MAG: DNA polymerase III subunit delta [Candidatus Jacksonbacteria bacterium RIFCSPLOWO2_02_FULL_44_20]